MFAKLGHPLPSLTRRSLFYAKKQPFIGKREQGWKAFPNERERLERFAQLSKNAIGTLPERIIWRWLEYREYAFTTQYTVGAAGARLDFLVFIGAPPGVAVRVQGSYWHSMSERVKSDAVQYLRLLAKGFRVVDLDELEIYNAVLNGNLYDWADEKLYEAA